MKIKYLALTALAAGLFVVHQTAHAGVHTQVSPVSAPITATIDAPTNSYPTGQCTWGAKALAPWAGDYWGDAGHWANAARAVGFEVGTLPKVGAIACWQDGSYGHVAVVTHVDNAHRIQVQESNFNKQQYIANFRGWFDPTASYLGTVSYIYPPQG